MTAKVTVGGKTLYTMLVSAANTLENNQSEINDLNVFPVPDGDTGTNMSLTLGAVRDIEPKNDDVSECATKAADAVLRSARGNSGAILALFFRGFSKSVKGKRTPARRTSPKLSRTEKRSLQGGDESDRGHHSHGHPQMRRGSGQGQ